MNEQKEIKLPRVWDKVMSEMLYPKWHKQGGLALYIYVSKKEPPNHSSLSWVIKHTKFFEVMYPTGCKDKNDKEIFDGDIVKIGHPKLIALIKYEHCGFVMEHCWGSKRREYCNNGKSEPIFKNCNISLEVIGNISQHPHLFKG